MVSSDTLCVRWRALWGVQPGAGVFWKGPCFGGELLTEFNGGRARVPGESLQSAKTFVCHGTQKAGHCRILRCIGRLLCPLCQQSTLLDSFFPTRNSGMGCRYSCTKQAYAVVARLLSKTFQSILRDALTAIVSGSSAPISKHGTGVSSPATLCLKF